VIYLCSCGFGTDDHDWSQCHAIEYPGHHAQLPWWDPHPASGAELAERGVGQLDALPGSPRA
jgi:hypothetical protein